MALATKLGIQIFRNSGNPDVRNARFAELRIFEIAEIRYSRNLEYERFFKIREIGNKELLPASDRTNICLSRMVQNKKYSQSSDVSDRLRVRGGISKFR